MNPVLARLRRVSHHYRNTAALQAIDLDIPAGGTVAFIGPDGVGKSTLLALLAGAIQVQGGRGQVEVLGGDMASRRQRRQICRQIAYMPQGLGRNLYPTLSVIENLQFFARLFGLSVRESEARCQHLLAATGMSAFAQRPAGQLSGGMKQKLGLCCALLHDPQLLILDEPTTGVDPLSRRQFWALIDQLRADRPDMSVLVATAYMEEAADFDWLVAMHAGQILARGTALELQTRTGADTLETAFIRLLPAELRQNHQELNWPPQDFSDRPIAIEAERLTRRFGDFVAVDAVSFRIHAGEIFGFLGSNGCGKTTTMKMLTGLLPADDGTALLFGQPMAAGDLAMRRRVGYMSQNFSLYNELTVEQNLQLHARLFHLPAEKIAARVSLMLERFELIDQAHERPENLPLGLRQRLQLAVAVIHEPELLILDEPTSGVDPVARNRFWQLLIELSRRDRVTIFISTHFMNEAERCDRISLMHAGRVLAQGAPAAICQTYQASTLEGAFVRCLTTAMPDPAITAVPAHRGPPQPAPPANAAPRQPSSPLPNTGQPDAGERTAGSHSADPAPGRAGNRLAALVHLGRQQMSTLRLMAYARRESQEILRDPIRLAFALLGPLLLMVVFGYGISFDVERLHYAVLDDDHSAASRSYLAHFSSSRYFREEAPIKDHAELERRMQSGQLKIAIEIPPDFGQSLSHGRTPEIAVWLDGTMPARAETSLAYVEAVHQRYLDDYFLARPEQKPPRSPLQMETRFRYNPELKSVPAIVPSVMMLLLVFIPSMMTAVAVVRERELGSITNLYVTPVTGMEFLLGKQLPYVVIACVNYLCLLALATALFGLPIKGSLLALSLGALLYACATTGIGLLVSSFVRTQVAALFATAILTTTPAIQFSGMFTPVSSLSGDARSIGLLFPSSYFQNLVMGSLTKGLGFDELQTNLWALLLATVLLLLLARGLLRTQGR